MGYPYTLHGFGIQFTIHKFTKVFSFLYKLSLNAFRDGLFSCGWGGLGVFFFLIFFPIIFAFSGIQWQYMSVRKIRFGSPSRIQQKSI